LQEGGRFGFTRKKRTPMLASIRGTKSRTIFWQVIEVELAARAPKAFGGKAPGG